MIELTPFLSELGFLGLLDFRMMDGRFV